MIHLEEIPTRTFSYCDNLKTIIFPNSIRKFGKESFVRCIGLEEITLPTSLERLEESSFFGCINLKSINLPDSVQFIGEECFNECVALESVTLSSSLREIQIGVFDETETLTKFIFPKFLWGGEKNDNVDNNVFSLPESSNVMNSIHFLCDLNVYGRCYLQREEGKSYPTSLWPLIFNRVCHSEPDPTRADEPERLGLQDQETLSHLCHQASVLYYFLLRSGMWQ